MDHMSTQDIREWLYKVAQDYATDLTRFEVAIIQEAVKRLKRLENLEDDGK